MAVIQCRIEVGLRRNEEMEEMLPNLQAKSLDRQ